jgi:hypothetical protein
MYSIVRHNCTGDVIRTPYCDAGDKYAVGEIYRKMLELGLRFTENYILDLQLELENLLRLDALEPRLMRFRENGVDSVPIIAKSNGTWEAPRINMAPGIQDWMLYIDRDTNEYVFARADVVDDAVRA